MSEPDLATAAIERSVKTLGVVMSELENGYLGACSPEELGNVLTDLQKVANDLRSFRLAPGRHHSSEWSDDPDRGKWHTVPLFRVVKSDV